LAASVAAMFLAHCTPVHGRGDAQGKIMATDETGQDPKLPPDARLDSLDERLDRLQRAEAARTGVKQPDPNYRVGQLVLSHLVGAPAGGFLIGLGLDSLFGTRPLFMLLMLFLGFGVGLMNVLRISKAPSGKGPGDQS
jgi:ATP synthase protein I